MSFETLRQVRRDNAEAQARERQREEEAAESNPAGTPTREGVPVDTWRALRRQP